ncbi:hypothetical protein SKAU_G00414700 [Synaphobranchus kaupii]|uniref:ribonuclease H n=1 Tax=Synaphobranchus kaupii TaxID=118154 RepID=A0A9Q1E749_SYNKA|nr:hypothetical protein SKAU_G00414700 [Synaphobranchus kaupii]
MEFSLPPLSPFLTLPGEPPIPWIRWQESFGTFIAAVGLEEASDSRKRALLIHNLGSEGQRIFRTFGPAPTYAECVTKLSGHFAAPQSVMFRRIVFRQRRQQTGESVHHYVADLRSLASLCKFGALEEELIRDQLAEHTNNPKFREKLLMSPDDLPLAKAVEMAFQMECAASLASQLAPSSPFPSRPMLLTQTVAPCTESQDSLEVNFAGRQGATAHQTCGNCGSSSHATRAPTCPALPRGCGANVVANQTILPGSAALPLLPPTHRHVHPGPPAPTTIHSVSATSRPFKWCTVELDGVCLPLLLDTAASKSLLNVSTVRRLFPLRTLKADADDLYGYGHNKIGMRWPSLFNGLGCLTAFNHQPLLSPEVRPVIQPLRRLPLALRDDVTAELHKLLEAGIIERLNASPWISNLVVAKKKSGGLRPCVDLRQVNKAVIPDKYPLPTVEELSAKFYGSTVFTKLDLRQGYLQVPLHPDSRFLTVFMTHVGVFRYTRMLFGLSSAPSCFQKIMATIFAGIPGVVIYLDDIVVHGLTPAVHDEHLARVTTSR